MQRLAHARRLRARNELAEQDDALGVGRPLRRLLAERRVERIDERFGGRGHRGLLPCVHRRPPLERSLPPSSAPRVLAFKPDLDAFLYLHRSCPCQTGQPSEWLKFQTAALRPEVPTTDIANCYICVLGGRNLMTAIKVIRMKMASTAACVTAKGGSVCVGANALRAETFTKLCTTKTKTLR